MLIACDPGRQVTFAMDVKGGKPTVRLRQTAEELRYTGRSEGARRLIFVDHIGLLSIAM